MTAFVESGLAKSADNKTPMSGQTRTGIISISVIIIIFVTTVIVIVVKKTTTPFEPVLTPSGILDKEGEKYLEELASTAENDADPLIEAEECEASYKLLTDLWNSFIKSPTKELKTELITARNKSKTACPEDSPKKLLKEETFKVQAEALYQKAKKEALSDVSKLKVMERALALVRLFEPGFESINPSASHILYEAVHPKVLSDYKSLMEMKTPDPALAKSLKNNWTVAKSLAEKILPTKVPEIYVPKSLSEYISNSIPALVEAADQAENNVKLQRKIAALKLFEPTNRYVQLLDSAKKIAFASDYIKKMAPLEKELIEAMAKTSILDLEASVQAIITLRESFKSPIDLGRMNLPQNPKFSDVLAAAFNVDSIRSPIEGILSKVVIDVFDRTLDKEKQKEVAKFVADLKRVFGFVPTFPELKACTSDVVSLQEYFNKNSSKAILRAGKWTTTSTSDSTSTPSGDSPTNDSGKTIVKLTDEERLQVAVTDFINVEFKNLPKAKTDFKKLYESLRKTSPAAYPVVEPTLALDKLILKRIYKRMDEIIAAGKGEDYKKDEAIRACMKALYRNSMDSAQVKNIKLAGNSFDFKKFFDLRFYSYRAEIAVASDLASLAPKVKTELEDFFKVPRSKPGESGAGVYFIEFSGRISTSFYNSKDEPTIKSVQLAFDALKLSEADRQSLDKYLELCEKYKNSITRFRNEMGLGYVPILKLLHKDMVRFYNESNDPALLAKIPPSFKQTLEPIPPFPP